MALSTDPAAVRQRELRVTDPERIRAIEKRSRDKRRDKIAEYGKQRWETNREHCNEIYRKYRQTHREKLRAAYKKFYYANREKRIAQAKESRQRNADRVRAWNKKRYWADRENLLRKNEEWCLANPEKLRRTQTKYVLERRKTDIVYRLRSILSARIREALKKGSLEKKNRTEELIGCTVAFLRQFIEHQFTKEMTWDNYGSHWHIDHIIPVKLFDLSDVEQQKKAFNYSNCRPLDAKKNIAKSDNLPGPHQALLL